ncbi:butyrophilin subfamily 2 member A2-like [Perca fluviatilis]|uniref:butyrophilin subfamily 2 member A2-like n=1 Tax=Perca fluviatilis TaxID=8168 RepID=UPI0019627B8B|nr:butyrophilin subfamily 2 member A2-like [Perca fluviatilis]
MVRDASSENTDIDCVNVSIWTTHTLKSLCKNCLLSVSSCSDIKNVTAKPGEDVLLHCQAPRGADIKAIVWIRNDLKSNKYVFARNGNHTNGIYQLPSYRGRVTLSDPEMKDGDVSVVLKNVSVNDTGTYECRVGIKKGEEPKVYSTNKLTVPVSGHSAGDMKETRMKETRMEDKDGGKTPTTLWTDSS